MTQYSPLQNSTIAALLASAYEARVNNLPMSIELATKALHQSRQLNDQTLIGKSLTHLALFHMIKGEYELSNQYSEEAIEVYKEIGDEKGIADARYNIASVCYKTDNYHLGLVQLMDCRLIYKKYNDHHSASKVEKSLGTIYEYFGDLTNALKSYELAIESAQLAGDLNLESNSYNPLSGIYLKQGNIDKAMELIQRAIHYKEKTGDYRGLAFSLYGRAKVFAAVNEFSRAEQDYKVALSMHHHHGEKLGAGMTYNKLGQLYVKMGRHQDAKTLLLEGIAFCTEYNILLFRSKCSLLLSEIAELEQDFSSAYRHLKAYQHQRETIISSQIKRVIDNFEAMTRMRDLEREAELQKERNEIIEKKNRAEEAARIKQEFLSTMSHEIRTPLNAVITITSLLQERAHEEDKKLLDSLRFSGNNLMRIVNDVLDFSKLESGKMTLDKQSIDLKEFFSNIEHTYQGLAQEKGIQLKVELDNQLCRSYEADETRLVQVIGNLLSNAIKFTESGGVQLKGNWLSSNETTDRILIEVIDTGPGIAQEYMEFIFESFAQSRSVTTRKKGGTGLGLAIVQKIVQLHDSKVLVESKPNEGSRFYFELELTRVENKDNILLSTGANLHGRSVLLVEDTLINAIVAKQLLGDWGLLVDHAEHGKAAIDMAAMKKYDIILMDIHMPEMNGYDASANIKTQDGPNKHTPIFALTADITADQHPDSETLFVDFLTKPIQINVAKDKLINTIN